MYWFRRLLLLGLVVLLGWGSIGLVSGDGDGAAAQGGARADDAAAGPTAPSSTGRSGGTSPGLLRGEPGPVQTVSRPVVVTSRLARPTADCRQGSVVVTPNVRGGAVAGEPVRLELVLRGPNAPAQGAACRLRLGAGQLLAQVVNPAGTPVWDVTDCPRELPVGAVTLRSGWQTAVALTWSGRRRDRSCVSATAPVEAGTYELQTAVVGGEPATSDFEVAAPRRQT